MEEINPKLLEGLTPEQKIKVMRHIQRKRLAKMAEEQKKAQEEQASKSSLFGDFYKRLKDGY